MIVTIVAMDDSSGCYSLSKAYVCQIQLGGLAHFKLFKPMWSLLKLLGLLPSSATCK